MTLGGLLVSLLIPLATATYIENVAANVDSVSTKKHEKFVPLVAFECGYRNKFISESGMWESDEDRYATCQSGKLDILKYCKKAYPKMNITNIVEYSHEVAIGDWCREEGTPCKWSHTVRPYQCIDGEFRSEALQVPHDCRFSHVNSRVHCNDYNHWKQESKDICAQKTFNEKNMTMRSFAVLEPCGLDLFTGVEFVCCPAGTVADDAVEQSVSAAKSEKIEKATKVDKAVETKAEKTKTLPLEDDDDEYDDDYTESDEDDDDDKSSEVGQDPYFKKVDPSTEHDSFRDAIERLEKKHRSKVDVVMKEWSELEARYNEMKEKDPKRADKFKVAMTNRFQKTVAALEEEHRSSKKQFEIVHEERVQTALNEKKRIATHDYRQALAQHVTSPNKPQVLKTIKAYIRTEEKDRTHTLNKYRHLLRSDQTEAKEYRETVLHKLRYIDLRINGTLAMLRDFPELEKQVTPVAIEYWADYRRENTPELSDKTIASLNTLDADAKNKKLVDMYQESYEKLHPSVKLNVRAPAETTTKKVIPVAAKVILPDDSQDSEEDDDQYYEDEDDEQVKKTEQKPKVIEILKKKPEIKKVEVKKTMVVKTEEKSVQTDNESDSDSDSDEDDDEEQVKELRVDIEPIIEEKQSFYRQEKLIQHQGNTAGAHGLSSQALFLFGVVFMVAACLMVVSILRRRRSHHGFIEVDVYTPEERHVSGMQVNGYENPTYSFFDSKA